MVGVLSFTRTCLGIIDLTFLFCLKLVIIPQSVNIYL